MTDAQKGRLYSALPGTMTLEDAYAVLATVADMLVDVKLAAQREEREKRTAIATRLEESQNHKRLPEGVATALRELKKY